MGVVSHFLDGEAYNWLLTEERRAPGLSWTEFTRAMRAYFIPQNEEFRVMDDWRGLAQGEGKLQDYVNKYRASMLQLELMTVNCVRLHGVLYGLKEWARREIEKQMPNSYEDALGMAERLIDSNYRRRTNPPPRSGGDKHWKHGKQCHQQQWQSEEPKEANPRHPPPTQIETGQTITGTRETQILPRVMVGEAPLPRVTIGPLESSHGGNAMRAEVITMKGIVPTNPHSLV